ncbi:MAG: response regulator [Bacteroidaceae bacterium]|nr:response regulator [Bacteroidaceae bacterium]MBR6699200.1 response regulator [Bacteroidaceae bacterium]
MKDYGTILVVDDNPAILTAARICLGGVFGKVITLASPESILATMNQERVDVVLLDMNFTLGVNSGQDGLLWLRSIHKRHPDVPVVLVTAYADIKLAVRGLKDGAADFVTKPWDNAELVRTLKDAIDKSKEIVPLEEVEAEHVRRVVEKCHGNISKAAEMLGITRQTLYAKIKK